MTWCCGWGTCPFARALVPPDEHSLTRRPACASHARCSTGVKVERLLGLDLGHADIHDSRLVRKCLRRS
jgi:hypothetical protein